MPLRAHLPSSASLRRPSPLVRAVCILVVLLLGVLVSARSASAQLHDGVELVRADLVADTTAIQAGRPFTVGLRMEMVPHWHTYWQYSGDAGLPTRIDWKLPPGFTAGPIQWPVPDKIASPGDIINYGYEHEVVLLTEIRPPADLPADTSVALQAKATWLVCAEVCIPGGQDLSLSLPVGPAAPANGDILDKYRALVPRAFGNDAGFTVERTVEPPAPADAGKVILNFTGLVLRPGESLDFYPLFPEDADVGHPTVASTVVTVPVNSGLPAAGRAAGGVLTVRGNGSLSAWAIPAGAPAVSPDAAAKSPPAGPSAQTGLLAATTTATSRPSPSTATLASTEAPAPAGSLGYYLLLGFLGGLILNVMPCVLPVISLKLFSFVRQANEEPARVLRLGLAYAAGVFAWFMGFAILVVILKAGGREVGYSFQLGNRWFLVGLCGVTFVFALNLLGVFEIILPGTITNAAGSASARQEGYAGAFLQGLLVTVLGSACTAPLLGSALGFAFTASAPVILLMFAAIATGLSAPFVLLSARPGWLKFLPRPGVWMERVKQATGFLLLATVIWLLWCLRGRGPETIVWTGALLLVLAVACWVQGTFNTLVASDGSRWTARAVIAVVILGGGWFCATEIATSEPPVATGKLAALPFAEQLEGALKTGRLVFVDYTADWCVNCHVNEKAVLDTDAVQQALRNHDAVFLKADYTRFPDDITRLLRRYGRAGVPTYVIYPAGKPDAPVVMPELLTRQIVLNAFAEADRRATGSNPVAQR